MAAIKIISGLTIAVILIGIALNLYQPKLTETTKDKLNVLIKRAVVYGKDLVQKFVEKASFNEEKRNATTGEKAKPNAQDELIEETSTEQRNTEGKSGVKERLMTSQELAQYDGSAEDSPGLYLAILGKIYDVSKGAQHYKPGGGYAFFTGKDASRAYVTGDFTEEGLTDDVLDLKGDQLLGVEEWTQFYQKDYEYVGKLVGRYYDENGEPTDYLIRVEAALEDARTQAQEVADERKVFPPCNSEWSHELGGKVWCSKMSGGIERDWAGVPRKLYRPGEELPRCVCVRDHGPPTGTKIDKDSTMVEEKGRGDLDHPHLQEYDNCPPNENSCKI